MSEGTLSYVATQLVLFYFKTVKGLFKKKDNYIARISTFTKLNTCFLTYLLVDQSQ